MRDYEDPRQLICRYGDPNTSRPCVMVALTMKSGANIIDICDAAKDRVREMQEVEQAIPPDIAVVPISDASKNVEAKIDQVLSNVMGAIVIVVVVVYLVVGFRSAAVMAANIPVVVLSAMALITLFDVQLEQISLASIIIALGLLVDNAVQVCDQSRTNQMAGMKPVEATVDGSNQLSTPMLMGTATTIAAFAPMLIGLQGQHPRVRLQSARHTLGHAGHQLGVGHDVLHDPGRRVHSRSARIPTKPSRPAAVAVRNCRPWQLGASPRPAAAASRRTAISSTVRSAARVERPLTSSSSRSASLSSCLVLAVMLPVGSEFFPKDLRDQFAVESLVAGKRRHRANGRSRPTGRRHPAEAESRRRRAGQPVLDDQGQPLQRIRAMRTMVGGGGSRWYLELGSGTAVT